MALARNHPSPALRWLAATFVFFFRGPPVLALLFMLYYGVPQVAWIRESWAWFFLKDGFTCAVVAFSLNSAAYVAEILANALRGVPVGEREAAIAMGFKPWDRFRLIVLPHQAFDGVEHPVLEPVRELIPQPVRPLALPPAQHEPPL